MEQKKRTISINLGAPMWSITAIFVALKLTGIIDWSWWWVLSPMWIGVALVVAVVVVVLLVSTMFSYFEGGRGR